MIFAKGKQNAPKIVVYTAIFSEQAEQYDVLRPVTVRSSAEFLAFTDTDIEVEGWSVLKRGTFLQPRRAARWHKCLPHVVLSSEVDYSVWMDGSLGLRVSPEQLIDEWMGKHDIVSFAHPVRDCAYDEAGAVIKKAKAPAWAVLAQMEQYKKDGFPRHMGLLGTCLVIRKHTYQMKQFNQLWWEQIDRHTVRDQLSVNYCLWRLGLECYAIPERAWRHPYFSFVQHQRREE